MGDKRAPRPDRGNLIGRREFLRKSGQVGALVALGGVVSSCSSSGSSGSQAGSGVRIPEHVPGPQPVSGGHYGGTVRVAWSDPPNSFDPALGYNLTGWDAITQLVYFGGLMAYDGQYGGPVPNLAAAPPVISADKTTLTFALRPGVKFHNGREIVSSDYKYAWERMLTPSLESWATSYLSSVVGANAMTNGKAKTLEGVETPNDSTLVVHLTAPDFTILNSMALPMTAPVPREEVERLGNTKFGEMPVGYGPFKIVSYNGATQTAVFERNTDYFWKGLPYIDKVTYHWGVDSQIQLLQLENKDVDLLGPGIPSSQVAKVLATPTLKPLAQLRPSPGNLWITMYVNQTPFQNKLVRQALNWAVDRANLGKVTFGTYAPWGAPFPPNIANFTPTFTPYGYDVAKAKQLLAQAGYPNGFSATLTVASSDPYPVVAEVVQQQLAAVGVKITLNQISSNALYSLEQAEPTGGGHLQMSTDSWFMVQPTPADEVDALYVTSGSSNDSHYSNKRVDALAAQARTVFDETERNRIYAQIQQLVGDDAPYIFLESANWVAGVGPAIHNYQYRGETYSYYDRMWVET